MFLDIIASYDPNNQEKYPRLAGRKRTIYSKDERIQLVEAIYNPVKTEFLEKYGERTTEFLLRGMKRLLTSGVSEVDDLLPYQKHILDGLMEKIGNSAL